MDRKLALALVEEALELDAGTIRGVHDHSLEVRVSVGRGTTNCDPSVCAPYEARACDFFGVFRMKREKDRDP